VIGEFPIVRQDVSDPQTVKTQFRWRRGVKDNLPRGLWYSSYDREMTRRQEVLHTPAQKLVIQPAQNWSAFVLAVEGRR
jgi:hypothetical protein